MSEHKVKSLTPPEAYGLITQDPQAVLIDVRSSMEFLFIGHPVESINIPWMDEPDWDINPDFVREVRKVMLGGAVHDDEMESAPVVLICRSGKRSLKAGAKLVEEGFTNVYNVAEGFEGPLDENHHRSTLGGWRYHGLPWQQV